MRLTVRPGLLFALAGAWVAVFTVWISIEIGGPGATKAFDDLGTTVTALLAAAAGGYAAAGFRGRRRLGWALVGAGSLSWGVGNAVWAFYELALGRDVPFPSAADFFYLAAIPLGAVGIALLPAPRRRPTLIAAAVVDGAIVAGVLLFISWALVGRQVLAHAATGGLGLAISLAYPLGDVVVVACCAYAAAYSSPPVRPIVLTLAAGWLCSAIADSGFAYLTAEGGYATGKLLDAGWVAGFALAGVASVLAARRPWPAPIRDARPALAGPIVFAAVAAGLVVRQLVIGNEPIAGILFWTSCSVVALIIVRQLLSAHDGRRIDRERNQAVAALSESEARLRQLVRDAPVVLFSLDRTGVVTLAKGHAIPDVEEAVGRNLHDFPDHPILALVDPALAGQETSGTITVRGRVAEVRCVPVLEEGEVTGVSGVVIDVSDRLAALEARRENDAKDRFLATMSHELRTPLNSILGFTQMLEMDGIGSLSERQRRYQSHIMTSGRQLLLLINELLDLAKVRAGQLEVACAPVEVGPLVEEAVQSVLPQARETGLTLDVRPMAGITAHADPRRLQQVLLNLLANAVKFTAAGGSVVVTADDQPDGVRIDVADTGIGIAARDQERIFEEFTQLDAGRSRSAEGTGLGLALSRALVRRMGGDLVVTSREGQGSTFSVLLPPASGPAGELPDELAEPAETLAKVAVGAGEADADGARRG